MNHDHVPEKPIDLDFLASFIRSDVNYRNTHDHALLDAYQSGIYDAALYFSGEAHLKITGKSKTSDDIKKFLRQSSFNNELVLKTSSGKLLKTTQEQEAFADQWVNQNNDIDYYTHLIAMIPNDNDKNKLDAIINDFFIDTLKNASYVYVEHTDTDSYHYHFIVNMPINNLLLTQLRSAFIAICVAYNTRLL